MKNVRQIYYLLKREIYRHQVVWCFQWPVPKSFEGAKGRVVTWKRD
jgi:hypothetical protein